MITATDIFEFSMCPYKTYNKFNRDKSLMLPLTEFSKKLMEIGREHEKEMVSHLKVSRPKYNYWDFEKGFEETLKLMKSGVDVIYQGLLKDKNYVGLPDLLFKRKGKSKLGNFYYAPGDVKSSSGSKIEQVMQVKFYNMLLKKVQGVKSDEGILILKKSSEVIDLNSNDDKFEEALIKIDLISNGLEYGMHIDGVCKDCPWRDVCIPLAKKTKDVSLVYGLSRQNHYLLLEKDIKTLKDLVDAENDKIIELLNCNEMTIFKWKTQASVLLKNKDKITKISLPKTKNHICLDIETSEDGKLYLIGLWRKNKFVKFFSEKDEKKIIEDFVEYCLGMKDYIFYHYSTYEKMVFKELFEKYKVDEEVRNEIYSRMIDIFQLVKKYAVLPLIFYNLKDVAKHFGFKWRAADASGGNSMLWFNEWKRTKDKKLLKKILNYNEDDVKATYVVLKKLSKGKV